MTVHFGDEQINRWIDTINIIITYGEMIALAGPCETSTIDNHDSSWLLSCITEIKFNVKF